MSRRGVLMLLEKKDGLLLIWQTGRQNNQIEYNSSFELRKFQRNDLSRFEEYLRKNGETDEANKIKNYLGKIFKERDIPKLIPVSDYAIDVHLYTLISTLDSYKERYKLDMNPDFQRDIVWTQEQQITFMEFLLQGGKANPIYFNHYDWSDRHDNSEQLNCMILVDGKQRLNSLIRFLNNEFAVFKNLDKENEGYFAKDFDALSPTVRFVINDLKTKKQVLQWYLQINKGNIAHTPEEIDKVERLLKKER